MALTGRQGSLDTAARDTMLSSAMFKIENTGTAVFSELGGISSEIEQAEYMEAGEKGPMLGKFIGRAKPPTVTLKRALSTGPDTTWIWEWHAEARWGLPKAYRMTTLGLYASNLPDKPKKAYLLINAFPSKVEIASMKAGGTEVILQTVMLMCDEIIDSP